MSQSSPQQQPQLEVESEDGAGFRAWAESRAPILLAIGILFALVAVLIVISTLHPR